MVHHVKKRELSALKEGSVERHKKTVITHLMETGEKAYRERQYDLANAYTTIALSLQPFDLDIIMRRVLILEKLSMFNEAIDEAYHMISLAPMDARGYLRASRVLLAQDKRVEALTLLETALKKVSLTDHRYHLLEIYKRRSQPQATTFVTRLPYEITRNIFKSLPINSLIRCTQVCKSWNQFIIHCSDLWRIIDLRDYPSQKRLPRNALAQCINRAIDLHSTKNNGISELWVGNKMTMYDVVDLLISKDCRNLSVLYMSDSDLTNRTWTRMMMKHICTNIAHLFLSHTDISIVDVMISGEYLPNLTQLVLDGCSFGYVFNNNNVNRFNLLGAENLTPSQYPSASISATSFPKLQILGISSVHDMSIFAFIWLLYRCPNLTMIRTMHACLTLTRIIIALAQYCPLLTYLEYSPVRSHISIPFEPNQLPLMSNMRTLKLHMEQDNNVLHTIVTQCRDSLQHLSAILNDANLSYFSHLNLLQLETLEIPISPHITEQSLCTLLKRLPNLSLLDVSYNSDAVTDQVMEVLATLKKLKTIRMFNCTQVSDVALLKCVQQNTSLHTLGLYQCQFKRETIESLVFNVLPEGVIECPLDFIVKSKKKIITDKQRKEFNKLVDNIYASMHSDMDHDFGQQQENQPQPNYNTSINSANIIEEDDLFNNNTLKDTLRKDDLWSIYI
ncbi:hypothetical protein BJ944DRAFT_122303 [Cunninghamella echinulata]|nr:hypothetical protein BJ944DRAFT_122303 [Cunninghamella echinulata]